jgi:hypothetical protein
MAFKPFIMKKFIPLLLLIPLLLACRKDKIELPPDVPGEPFIENECVSLVFPPPPIISFMFQYYTMVNEKYPKVIYYDVNPHNPDEIVAAYIEAPYQPRKLAKIDLKTKNVTVLFDPGNSYPQIYSKPRWSRKNWIIFEGQSGPQAWDIYKIKSDGDSLTRLTYRGNCLKPDWNWKGDKFICFISPAQIPINGIFDENGVFLDTAFSVVNGGSWRHPSYYVTHSPDWTIYVSHPAADSMVFKMEVEKASKHARTADWIDDENFLWSSGNGVFRTNIVTGKTRTLIASCDAIVYNFPAYSHLTRKAIFRKEMRAFPEGTYPGTLEMTYIRLDVDDATQEVIEIDVF